MRLYKVTIAPLNWDLYDSAVIACKSLEDLQNMLDNGYFRKWATDNSIVEDIEYQQGFSIDEYQHVESIEGIGYTEMQTNKRAVVIISSFNAG